MRKKASAVLFVVILLYSLIMAGCGRTEDKWRACV